MRSVMGFLVVMLACGCEMGPDEGASPDEQNLGERATATIVSPGEVAATTELPALTTLPASVDEPVGAVQEPSAQLTLEAEFDTAWAAPGDFSRTGVITEEIVASNCAPYYVGDIYEVEVVLSSTDGVLSLDVPWFPLLTGTTQQGQIALTGWQEFMVTGGSAACTVDAGAVLGKDTVSGTVTEVVDYSYGATCVATGKYTILLD